VIQLVVFLLPILCPTKEEPSCTQKLIYAKAGLIKNFYSSDIFIKDRP
jgi:hypothetical protein